MAETEIPPVRRFTLSDSFGKVSNIFIIKQEIHT